MLMFFFVIVATIRCHKEDQLSPTKSLIEKEIGEWLRNSIVRRAKAVSAAHAGSPADNDY